MDDDDLTRQALAAGRGDRVAAATFVRATQVELRRFLGHLSGPGPADDLVQETYLRVWKSLPRFAGRSSARTWLYAIARRVAVDHVRSVTSRPRVAALEDWEAAVDSVVHQPRFEEQTELRRLLDDLSPERRDAFVATQVLGLSYAEAAEVCDCPVGTIRSRVARAREDLVAALRATDRRVS